jgi:phosphoglycerol transferase MdoB-like AlkP superfamily enzyme
MSNNNSGTSTGISTLSLLGVAFIILKLCKVINWSWWYVTMPFWGGLVIVLFVFIIVLSVKLIFKRKKNKQIKEMLSVNNVSEVKPKSRFQQRLEEMQKQNSKLNK